MFGCRPIIPLLGLVLVVRGQFSMFGKSFEDDFVDMQFDGCEQCEHNFRNMVFILKSPDETEQSVISIYSIVVIIIWLCLGVMVAVQRWRKFKFGAYRAYELLR
ncbi:hypothetical protein AWZ03_010212 [Drosophila navojoa]|uniref:Uncharacterized protein n=1 Tax=Drosophila navojoa TaxID=7232 RepID=A0A484B3V6_DRONA|nr:hypothetical protein AWZ03_010212 [Drosophila navojoa]